MATRLEKQRLDMQVVMGPIFRLHHNRSILKVQAMGSCYCEIQRVFLVEIEGVTSSISVSRNIVIID